METSDQIGRVHVQGEGQGRNDGHSGGEGDKEAVQDEEDGVAAPQTVQKHVAGCKKREIIISYKAPI